MEHIGLIIKTFSFLNYWYLHLACSIIDNRFIEKHLPRGSVKYTKILLDL